MQDSQAAEEAPMEEASASAVPSELYPLNILQMIRAAQQSNGLKHGDYARYRCAGHALTTRHVGKKYIPCVDVC
jgi:hypothetical protein